MTSKWLRYPENKPIEAGYYGTIYWNEEQKRTLWKAFWYSPDKGWQFRFVPKVLVYYNVRFDFYVPCQIQPLEEKVPDDIRKELTEVDTYDLRTQTSEQG
jgi:hypothetical protein